MSGRAGVYSMTGDSGTLLASVAFTGADLLLEVGACGPPIQWPCATELTLTPAAAAPVELTSGQALLVLLHAPGLLVAARQLAVPSLWNLPLPSNPLPASSPFSLYPADNSSTEMVQIAAYVVVNATQAGTPPPPTTTPPPSTAAPSTAPPSTVPDNTTAPAKKKGKKVGALPLWAFVLIMIFIVMVILSIIVSFVIKKCQDKD